MSRPLTGPRAMCFVLALVVFSSVPVHAQRKLSEKDSIAAQMDAVDALRQFQYQYSVLVLAPRRQQEAGAMNQIYGVCEIRITEFCYGPLNGKLKYGAIGTHYSQGLLTADSMPRMWRQRSNALVSRYIGELQRQQKKVPGDRWINGELVRVHIENGFPARAQDAIGKCQDTSWWCDALRAHVIHASGAWRSADSAWLAVLTRMSPAERCEWLDPTTVIADKKLRAAFSELACDEAVRLHERFWWLSDPFFASPGNERRSAHLSRNVTLLLDRATQDRVWATLAIVREGQVEQLRTLAVVDADTRLLQSCGYYGSGEHERFIPQLLFGYPELVLRVGVPSYCGLIDEPGPIPPGSVTSSGRGTAIRPEDAPRRAQFTQYPLTRQSFLPAPEAFNAPAQSLAGDWDLRDPQAYEFMTGWTRPVLDWWYQAAWFKRGDSARLVVAAEEAPQDLPKDLARPVINQLRGDLWLQSDYDKPFTHFSVTGTTRLLFSSMLLPQRALASVEAENPRGPFGRVRFGTGPQQMPDQRVTLSDVLLVEATFGRDTLGLAGVNNRPLPVNLDDAAPRALPTTSIREGSGTGLFWEMYGLQRGETPRISILVVRQEGREPVRMGRGPTRPTGDVVSTEWDEPAVTGAAIESRAVNLALASLRRGVYTLSLAVTVPGQEVVESVRTIVIR